MKKIELLAPAGDLEKLKIAVMYGADAVFIGASMFSLRSRASNFTYEDIKEGCLFAHENNCLVHVTCNIVMHEDDTEGILEHLLELEKCNVDAIICSSIYIANLVVTKTKMQAHISTQQSANNSLDVKFYESLNASRVVLARELSLDEIKDIVSKTDTEIEVFIHGGMCVSYSGRCMLSNVMTNRDANRGGCAHSCRWNYDLYDGDTLVNDDDMYFSMSSKDLCAIKEIPQLIDMGVSSLKIEGRMKSLHYIATVVGTYRRLIDDYYNNTLEDFSVYETEIKKAENRLTSYGFLHGMTSVSEQLYNLRSEQPTQEFVGIVMNYDNETSMVMVEERNFFKSNSLIEVFGPDLLPTKVQIGSLYDKDKNEIDAARHPLEIVYFKCDIPLKKYDMIRLVK